MSAKDRSGGLPAEAAALLDFWFSDRARELWFERDDLFDADIRSNFAGLCGFAREGALAFWEEKPESALALTILLDQCPRNMHRGSPDAFACDPLAREVARRAIGRGFDLATPRDRRVFFYLPFEHSEDLADQERSLELFRAWVETSPPEKRADAEHQFEYVLRHEEIVRRFGRFPHRNTTLGRASTAEEVEFLKEPRSSF